MDTPPILTTRSQLMILDMQHAPLLAEFHLRNRAHLAQWEGQKDDDFFTVEACQQRIARSQALWQQGAEYRFIALSLDGQQILATCALSNLVRGLFQACHFGYSVCAQQQGKGLMFEVAQAVIEYAFGQLQLHRLMANYMPANVRSERLLQRLGFSREGYAKDYLKIAGKWEDHVLTALINPQAM